jgi:DDE superfamily endonuclease
VVNKEALGYLEDPRYEYCRINAYEIFKNKPPLIALQVENVLDLGYMGVQNDFPTVKSVLPFRKSRKKSELSNEEKKYNRKHSKLRVIVEHTVSRIKKFEIMGTKFRNKLKRYDNASDIVSGLINFRIMQNNRTLL